QLWLQLIEKIPNCNGAPEQHGYISNLYVRPECRGGVGSRLLQQALEWLKQKEVDAVILWPSPRSRTLYMRHGFKAPSEILELRGPTVDSRFENIEPT
ncbi:MAG TPA: GNAT family N-acetyltransferase, partial [Terriglobales bacterium]|nr:GNAT family N-acetyltransferase [Terriglobales bacterium]